MREVPGQAGVPAGRVVSEPVSLRDIPATVVDLLGLADSSPFPGRSLARLWAAPSTETAPLETEGALSELAAPNPSNPNRGRSKAARGPLASPAAGDFVYIRNEGDGDEELFNRREDPDELTNLAGDQSMLPVLQRFRDRLSRAKHGVPSLAFFLGTASQPGENQRARSFPRPSILAE